MTLQLDNLKSQVSQAQLEELATDQGTEVIQRASSATGLSPVDFLLPVVLGIIGGLVVGYVGVVALSRRDRRLRTRDAIAEAVGAPVLLSVEERPRKSTKDWTELLEHYTPAPSAQWHIRRGLRELGLGGGAQEPKVVRMLAFGEDDGATAAAVEVAVVSAISGTETRLAIGGSPDGQVALRSVCARLDAEGLRPRSHLAVRNDLEGPPGSPNAVTFELHVLDRSEPEATRSWRAEDPVVMVVSAGRVGAEDLARVAIAVDAVGLRVAGIAVVNPASEDSTVGRFSEGDVRRASASRRPAESGAHVPPARAR